MIAKYLSKLWVRNLVIACGAILVLSIVLLMRDVLTPVLVALTIAYLGDPIIDKFEEWKIQRTWGIVLLIFILALVTGGLLIYLLPKLISQINELAHLLPVYWERMNSQMIPELEAFLARHPDQVEKAKAAAVAWLQDNGAKLAGNLTSGLAFSFRSLGNFIANVLGMLIVPVLAFYLLRDFDIMKGKIADLIPVKRRDYWVQLFTELDQALGNFLQGQLLVALILSIIYSIGLTIAQCPAGLLIGVLAGFANLVPYLGLALGLVPALLLTYLSGNPMWQVIVAGVSFLVGQMLEGMVITPRIVGKSVGLHPVMVLIALMIGGNYFGLLGMILALPVSAVMVVISRRAYRYYIRSVLYHEDEEMVIEQPKPEPRRIT